MIMENRSTRIKETQHPLLAAKLYIPQPRPDLVQRTHLIDRLNVGIYQKLTLISAPAGFGKTTLLSEWISQSEIPVAWISLDKGDGDSVHFIHYLVAALQSIQVNLGNAALSMLRSPQQPPIESIMISLIKEITDIPNDFVLVFDDYHSIDTEKIHNMVEFLLDYLPEPMHLIIATRVDPPLPLARLRACNQLNELRTSDLCFTEDETTLFFNRTMNLKLSSHDISILESRTEGWIAALQLAGISMQNRKDVPSFIKTFAGDDRHIVDYLAEEVLNLQTDQTLNFLLQTSILKRLSEPLCDFVTNKKGSQKILDGLEKANLFIVPLDNKRCWYRYHHLFADLLRQRLHQTNGLLVPELHRRASQWYEQNGLKDKAVDHALAALDFARAADLIEEHVDATWLHGEHTQLWHWLEELPAELVLSKPHLSILHAWDQLANGQQNAAEQSLEAAEQALDPNTVPSTETSPIERDRPSVVYGTKLQGRIAATRALAASYRGDVAGIIQYARQALEYLPEQDSGWRSTAAMALGDAHSIQGEMAVAHRARLEALEASKATGNIYLIMLTSLRLSVTLRQRGRLQQVLEICRELMQLAEENSLAQTAMAGWLLATWGEVLAEVNSLEEATDKAGKGVGLTESGYDVALPVLGWSYLGLMRVLFSRGDMAGVEEIIKKMEDMAREFHVPPWITNQIAAWKGRIWLARGKLADLSRWVQERGLDLNEEPPFLHEMEYVVLARVLMAKGRLDEGIRLLQRLLKAAETGGRIPRVIEILMLQAVGLEAGGDTTQAMATLDRALTLAEPEGFVRIFVDEGPPIAQLLEKILDAKGHVPRAYVKKLLSAFRLNRIIKTDDGLVERLSERELEVLRLLAAGLSNKKITEELFISLSTVKTHIRNIYSKIDVHSRTNAIIRAKELGLI
jgi:LuxR family maltose regulon positive regulatory protein